MTRLRSLIKEVLTVKPKEDCGCGCNDCDGKAPIITEGKIKKAISEGLTYHVENKIPLHESVYRIGSEKHFALINEARKLWTRGLINVSEDDQAILETHLGNFGMYEGEKVPLDMPMVNEEKEYYVTYNKGRGQGKGLVKSKESNYEEPRVFSKEEAEEYAKGAESRSRQMTAYWVSDKDMNRLNEGFKDYLGYSDHSEEKELEKDYIEHLQNIRNDFYNKGDKEKAAEVQADIDKLLGKSLEEAKKKSKSKKKDPPLNKPKRGGSKAYYVYVRDPKTKKIKKVSFGSGGLRAKIKNKEARNAFAARHNCKNKKDRTKAGYWSCNLPRYAEQLGLGSKMNTFW